MKKLKTYDLFLESNNKKIDIYGFKDYLNNNTEYLPSLDWIKKMSEKFIGPGIYDKVEKLTDDIFTSLENIDMDSLNFAMYEIFDEFLDKDKAVRLCVLSKSLKVDNSYNRSQMIRLDQNSKKWVICSILVDIISPTLNIAYPPVNLRQTTEEVYVDDPKYNCLNFNIENYEIFKSIGKDIPNDFGGRKTKTVITQSSINDKLKYNIDEISQCYKPGIYISIGELSGYSDKSAISIDYFESLFDKHMSNILRDIDYEEIIWPFSRGRRAFDGSIKVNDFTIKVVLK